MGLVANYREGRRARSRLAEVDRLVDQREESLNILSERLAELELATEDEGWQRLGREGARDFTPEGRRRIVALARIMYLKNPLIRRGVNVQAYYVMGQGLAITGRSAPVDAVVQGFIEDQANRTELTSQQALSQKEIDLQTDGELFLALFTNASTGKVRVRSVAPEEIQAIITNPEDDREPWYYLRTWQQASTALDTGRETTSERAAYYPDWRHRPEGGKHPTAIGDIEVAADIPMYHMAVGTTSGMRRGVPDVYAALDWARAYKTFLEDWASLTSSLSRWAWKYTTGKRQKVDAVRERIGTNLTTNSPDTNPAPSTGAVFVQPSDGDLAPIPKTGANVSSDDGKQLRTMVAAALDIPDSILSNDPQQGALATAKTLDRPTELAMKDRQSLWISVFRDLTFFVVEQSVLAPSGPLTGSATEDDGRVTITLEVDPVTGEPYDAGVDVDFPPILEQDTNAAVQAIVSAATLDGKTLAGTIPERDTSRYLLGALGEPDISGVLDELYPPTEVDTTTEAGKAIAVFRADLREFIDAAHNGNGSSA